MTKQPEDTIRDGHLKATIWKNESDKGAFHSTTLAQTYEDTDGNLKDSSSFLTSDLLRISELARTAYNRSRELRHQDGKNKQIDDEKNQQHSAEAQQSQDSDRDAFHDKRRESRAAQPIRENRR